jgi:hypothetical protein
VGPGAMSNHITWSNRRGAVYVGAIRGERLFEITWAADKSENATDATPWLLTSTLPGCRGIRCADVHRAKVFAESVLRVFLANIGAEWKRGVR